MNHNNYFKYSVRESYRSLFKCFLVHGSPSALSYKKRPVGHSAQHLPLCSAQETGWGTNNTRIKRWWQNFHFHSNYLFNTVIHLRKRKMIPRRIRTQEKKLRNPKSERTGNTSLGWTKPGQGGRRKKIQYIFNLADVMWLHSCRRLQIS